MASRIIRCPAQFFVVFTQVAGHFHDELRKRLPVLCDDGAVGCFRHMQDDVVVVGVFVMPVGVPIGSPSVNLDVTHPCRTVQFDFGVEKSGPASRLSVPGSMTSSVRPSVVCNGLSGNSLYFQM